LNARFHRDEEGDAPLSNTLTAFRLPPGFSYEALHDAFKEHDYIIYAGQCYLGSDVFRTAAIGELSLAVPRAFLAVLEKVLGSRPLAAIAPTLIVKGSGSTPSFVVVVTTHSSIVRGELP